MAARLSLTIISSNQGTHALGGRPALIIFRGTPRGESALQSQARPQRTTTGRRDAQSSCAAIICQPAAPVAAANTRAEAVRGRRMESFIHVVRLRAAQHLGGCMMLTRVLDWQVDRCLRCALHARSPEAAEAWALLADYYLGLLDMLTQVPPPGASLAIALPREAA